MAGLSTGAGAPVVMVYHEKSMILPDVSRVLACLYEKDVKFECVKDSYKDILRLQASRSVPVPFYDGPTFLQESRAICRYIAETYKQRGYPFLLGKDVLERASIEQWLRHEEHAFDPPSRALFCHLAFPLHDDDDENINGEKRKLEEVLAVYEQRLGESEFLAGNKFTLADLAHLPNTHHIVTSEKFAYLYDSRKNVQRWWNTISARDSWQQVLRDMKSVKEQYQMEEYEQQQQQWQKEPPPTYGASNIRIDARAHTGTVSQIIVIPPPSTGFIATSFPSVQQEEQPPPAKTTSHDKSSPIQQKESNFFTTPEKTPTTTKTPPRTETDKSSSEDASSPTKPSQTSSKEAPDKMASSHTDEAATLTKPTPPQALKTSNRIHDSEAVAPDKPSPTSAKAPHKFDEPDFYETESKPASVGPWVDKPVSYTKPDPQTSKTPYTEPPAQRAADTSGPEAGETPSDQRSVMQTPDAQQRSEQDTMASTNQRAAARLAEKVAAKDAQGETAPQAGHHGARDITKEAREADQRKATSAPTRELPSGDQNGNQQSKAPPTDLKVSDSSPLKAEFKEDAQGAMSEDERFSTKRLRKMFEESEAAVLRSQSTDLQAPEKEETPSVYKKPSDVQDRKRQAGSISADGKNGTPSTGTRAPGTTTSADERRDTSPPKGGMAHDDHGAAEPQKSPSSNEQEPAPPVPSQSPTNSAGRDDDLAQLSTIDQWRHASAPPSPIQQVSPGAPSIDEVAKTASVGRRAPTSTPKQTPTDARNALAPVQGAAPSADGISDEQSDKSIMDERVPELTQRQAPSSDTRRTSASIQEAIRAPHGPSDDMLGKTSGTDQIATPAASKQTPARGEVPDVRDTIDDTTKKPAVDTKAAPTPPRQEPDSSSQQTTEQIKGVAPTSHGITGDESAKIAMADESATPPAPASDGRVASTALKGGILDARVKNEAVASVADPSGMPTTPRRPAPTPDTQRRTTLDQASDQAPPFPSFAETMNEKTGIAEAGRTNTIAPNEQPGGRIPKNAGAPAAGPSPMKSQKNMNEAYNDGPSIQQLSSDQSRAQLAENKKQGDDATPLTEIGKPKEDDFLANANQNNTGQAQVTSTDGPSKLQMQSDQNKPISSKDIGKRTNETVSYKSSATSREMLPSVPDKSMRENQLQGDKSSISLQDNVKQGSEAALSVSGTKQPKKRDLLTNVDQNSGKTPGEAIQKSKERTSSDTQQVKSNTSNSKSDGSSKPTQFGGNEGNLPESQRRGSSTSP